MWSSILVLFLSVSGSLAFDVFGECDKKCDTSNLLEGIEGMLPNAEELKTVCTPILERTVCLRNTVKECTGKDLQELALSDNTTVASFATLLLNMEGVVIDVCNEDSILHEGYVSSITCFNNLLSEQGASSREKCSKEASAVYHSYRDTMKLLDEEASEHKMKDADCLITAYVTACFSLEVQEQCGEIARATFVEILKRSQFISFGSGACTRDQLAGLRTEYLDFLEFEEQKKTWFGEVFNTRK